MKRLRTANTAGTILLLALCNSGCSSDSDLEEATGKGSISALHAISDLGSVRFLIEETTLASIDFKQSSGISDYDDLTYEFNFDILLPEDTEYTRLTTTEVSVVAETEYTFVFAGTLENPQVLQWEQFSRDWQLLIDEAVENETEITILDMSFGHLASTAGALDIYLGSPGIAPVLGNQAATLQYGEHQESLEISADEYQLVVTNAGDPTNYLFASDPFTLAAAFNVTIVVMDAVESDTSDFTVRLIGSGAGTELVEIDGLSTMRVVHAADNTDAIDVIVGDNFANPIAANVEFGERTTQAETPTGAINLNITPANNPGSFLAEEEVNVLKGARYSLFLTGIPGDLDGFMFRDSARRLVTHAVLRVYQGASRLNALDFYLVAAGSDISLLAPTLSSLGYLSSSGYQLITPGSYDLIFTLPGTKTVVAGPLRREMNALGIFDAVTTNTSQTDAAGISFFDDG